jgi:hypothetical protein
MTTANPFDPSKPLLLEGLQYKDLDGMMKPTIHVDEFAAKLGDDADVIVLSFFVRDRQAARDLMAWFEKGYDFVLDADVSPGEIKPGRYLVYVEIRRRSAAARHIETLLDDLSTLTEFDAADWTVHHSDGEFDWNQQDFAKYIPLTPDAYRARNDEDLNDVRTAAGIEPKKIYEPTTESLALQSLAGIR